MATGEIFEIARQGLLLVFFLSLPILGIAFLAAMISAILQLFGRVNEPTLSYLPRIISVFIVLIIGGPWMSSRVADFATRVWSAIQVVQP